MATTEVVETESPSVTASSPVTPSVLSQSQSIDSMTSASASASSGSGAGCGIGESAVTPTRRRYPANLSHGSPPGTQRQRARPNSSHYETMEDLLAAAGYSVTRVFTPETERVKRLSSGGGDESGKGGEGDGKGEVGGGIGTLVAGWFAHIMPAAGASPGPARTPEVEEDAEANPFLRPAPGAGGRHLSQATRSVSRLFRSLCWVSRSLLSSPSPVCSAVAYACFWDSCAHI